MTIDEAQCWLKKNGWTAYGKWIVLYDEDTGLQKNCLYFCDDQELIIGTRTLQIEKLKEHAVEMFATLKFIQLNCDDKFIQQFVKRVIDKAV